VLPDLQAAGEGTRTLQPSASMRRTVRDPSSPRNRT
jgi:hypothetical protein